MSTSPPGSSDKPGELLARKFHELYERLAPSFGYATREETRAFDPTSSNGRLMIAVCEVIAADLVKPGIPCWCPYCDQPHSVAQRETHERK